MKHSISEESSRKIVNLSFLCAVFVCIIHVKWPTETETGWLLVFLFKQMICAVGVPFFFVVSGYFLVRHCEEPGWWGRAVRKRIGTLVIPYCVWQFVTAFVYLLFEHRWPLRPGGFGLNPFIPPNLVPLWYLRTLMIFVVASPLVVKALKRWGRGFLAAAFVANLVVGVFAAQGMIPEESRVGGLVYYTFSVKGIFYFSLGAYLALRPMTLSRRAGNLCGVVALAFMVVQLAVCHFRWAVPFDFCVFVLPTLMAFLWVHAPATRMPSVLAQATFPVYLMHAIVYAALRLGGVFSGMSGAWCELFVGVSFSILVSAILHRFCPFLARLAFGGR